MTSITIALPIPNRVLSPNTRSHWAVKARHTKQYRTLANLTAVAALKGKRPPGWTTATTTIKAYYKQHRQRDADNLLASLKSAFDGIADSGIIANDSGLSHEPVTIGRDVINPRIEITLTQH